MSLREWPADCHQVVQGQWCHWSEGPGSESRGQDCIETALSRR